MSNRNGIFKNSALALALALSGATLTAQPPQASPVTSQAAAPQVETPAEGAAPAAADGQAAPPQPGAQPGSSRRDPFRPIVIRRMTGQDIPARLPPGKPGLVIGQLTLQGIVRGVSGKWIAVVDNKTNRAYFLYEQDELFNGTVSRITPDEVVFQERVMDAAGRSATREVVKKLNPS